MTIGKSMQDADVTLSMLACRCRHTPMIGDCRQNRVQVQTLELFPRGRSVRAAASFLIIPVEQGTA